jgi:hypothetical protein
MFILDVLPIWAIFLLTAAFCFLAGELGFRAGRWLHRHYPDAEKGSSIGVLAGGLLGLLAFLLAFSIGLALNMFKSRMDLVVTEANAIGTSYLRAGFLEEPDRTEVRGLLREYVDVRLAAIDPAELEDAIARSEEIHNQLWSIVEPTARENLQSDIIGLLVDSINEVIDIHTMRVFAYTLRVPRLLWLVFYATAGLSFGLVGLINSADNRRNLTTLVLFALVVAAVLALIMDLDGSQTGQLRIVQQPLLDLQKQFSVP